LDAARDQEISRWKLYDYVIVNRDVQEALQQVRAILIAERLRRTRSEDAICSFVKDLLSGA
ncbi:MAG: guanylate kinase, partial [Beijerinckiaceae bacterium]|nr:guanylate kinase [Beijerinckiaceae bacterium]